MDPTTPARRLVWAREQHGKHPSATAAARAYGWPVSTYLGHENGDRNPSRAAAKRYARAYHVRWEWLLEGEGQPTAKRRRVKIIGFVGARGEVTLYPPDKIVETAEQPPGEDIATVAIEVSGEAAMRGIADDGWLIFFDDVRQPPSADLVGKLCVLELDGGKVLVRTIQPGRRRGRYDLEHSVEPTLRDQRVIWAARVTWLKPR